MNGSIRICEVGLRDGLQGYPDPLAFEDRLLLFEGLQESGLNYIELGSFVNPKAVPQMAETARLFQEISRHQRQELTALIFNEKGLDQASACEASGVAIVVVHTETLSQKNNRCSQEESLNRGLKLAREAKARGLMTRIDLAPSWHCPYEGPVPQKVILASVAAFEEEDVDEICLCDTIGWASPYEVKSLLQAVAENHSLTKIGVHFHDTQAMGMANAVVALDLGIRIFDSSFGGLGGCPFAKGARGNIATEDLVLLAHRMGYDTGIDLNILHKKIESFSGILRTRLGGRTSAFWQSLSPEHKALIGRSS